MMRRLVLFAAAMIALAHPARAQQQIYEADDLVDPGQLGGVLVSSRLVAGAVSGLEDHYRPTHQNGSVVHFMNNVVRNRWQLSLKLTRVVTNEDAPARLQGCACSPPLYFPTPAPADATPAAPLPSLKETLQGGYYIAIPRPGNVPVMLRVRVTETHQAVTSIVSYPQSGQPDTRVRGREQSFGIESDTWLPLGGHDVWGKVSYTRLAQTGTPAPRRQQELTYTNHFPGRAIRNVLVLTDLTVGGVTGRGGTAMNVVNPRVEASWYAPSTRVNLHLVWSPQATRSGAEGWEIHHQIAVFADRALFFRIFGRSRAAE